MKLKALDLFCGAGGATRGLQMAGFHVTGVDSHLQPRYCGDKFHRADAMSYPLNGFDFVWASPPCQKYTRMTQGLLESQGRGREYDDLVAPIRERLVAAGIPYTIENVVGAPLIHPIMLCGSSFGLLVERHRLFESSFAMLAPRCAHHLQISDKPSLHRHNKHGRSRVVGCYGGGRGTGDNVALWKKAMGISWMIRRELAQAIPPAYSEFIGNYAQVAVQDFWKGCLICQSP